MQDRLAGYLSQTENGYYFIYGWNYLQMQGAETVSLTTHKAIESLYQKFSTNIEQWMRFIAISFLQE